MDVRCVFEALKNRVISTFSITISDALPYTFFC